MIRLTSLFEVSGNLRTCRLLLESSRVLWQGQGLSQNGLEGPVDHHGGWK
jgi:hypothetical protein